MLYLLLYFIVSQATRQRVAYLLTGRDVRVQLVGPGTLYPATELALLQWWSARRGRVQSVVQSVGSIFGMLMLPAILSVASCDDGECWRRAYISVGIGLLLPVCILAVLLVDGGAVDHEMLLDAQPHPPPPTATEPTDTLEPQPTALPEERWSLHDALTHTSFWLAQVSHHCPCGYYRSAAGGEQSLGSALFNEFVLSCA